MKQFLRTFSEYVKWNANNLRGRFTKCDPHIRTIHTNYIRLLLRTQMTKHACSPHDKSSLAPFSCSRRTRRPPHALISHTLFRSRPPLDSFLSPRRSLPAQQPSLRAGLPASLQRQGRGRSTLSEGVEISHKQPGPLNIYVRGE